MRRSATPDRQVGGPSPAARTAPEAAQILLPVWGQSYVHQFLHFGLPTLLSPGNLPYVAARLPCQLVVLTSSEDCASLTDSPLMSRVRAAGCGLQVRPIDHLITHTNQSTTITLAITEAIVASGPEMLKTCFFLTVSDYIYAVGSLQSVMDLMLSGSSAVLVGNFQVAGESALPSLCRTLEWAGQTPVLPPRQLMGWALTHLHPATVANTVNIPFNHNAHTNRLFWRVDDTTVLGRFYLRHPICVRPETTDFLIGSSLDYSFIPEMCPSGNVAAITDSDEYLVVEMQPADHEAALLRFGPLPPKSLAKSLAEWTTREQRANVADVHVFHSQEIPASRTEVVRQEADDFVAAVAGRLKSRPRPHRGHTYWKGAIAAFWAARAPTYRTRPLDHVYGVEQMSWLSRCWRRREAIVFGQPPAVHPWDHKWPDFAAIRAELDAATKPPGARLLLVADRPTLLSVSLSSGAQIERIRTESIARNPPLSASAVGAPFQACLVELAVGEVNSAKLLLERVGRYVSPGGRVLVLTNLTHTNAARLAALSSPLLDLVGQRLVARNSVRQAVGRASRFLHHLAGGQPWLGLPLAIGLGPFILVASLVGNALSVRGQRGHRLAVRGYSSMVMVFQVAPHDEQPTVAVEERPESDQADLAGPAKMNGTDSGDNVVLEGAT